MTMKINEAFYKLNELLKKNAPYEISYELSRGTKTISGAHLICNRTTIGLPLTTKNVLISTLFSSKNFSIVEVVDPKTNANYQAIQGKDGTPIKINKNYEELNDYVLSKVEKIINELFPPKSKHHKSLESMAARFNSEQMDCFVETKDRVYVWTDFISISDSAPNLIFATNKYTTYNELHALLKSLSVMFEGYSDSVDDGHPRRYRTRITQDLTEEQSKQLQQYVTMSTAAKSSENIVSRVGIFGKTRVIPEARYTTDNQVKINATVI